jgi:hypothetical protein
MSMISIFDDMECFEHAEYTFLKSKFEKAGLLYELKHEMNPGGLILVDTLGRIVSSSSNIRLIPKWETALLTSLSSLFAERAIPLLIKGYLVGDPTTLPLVITWEGPFFFQWLSRLYFQHFSSFQLRKKNDPSWSLHTLEIRTLRKERTCDAYHFWTATVLVVPTLMVLNRELVTTEDLQEQYSKGPGFWNWFSPNLCLTLRFSCHYSGDLCRSGQNFQ